MQTQETTRTPESTVTSENLRSLQPLLGAWRGEGTFKAGPVSGPVKVEWTFTPCAGGFGVEGALVVRGIPGVEICEQKDLLAYDRAEQKLRWISICNSEELHDRRGSIDGSALVVSDPSERIRVRFLDERRISVEITSDAATAEAVLTR